MFTLTISTDNAAFDEAADAGRCETARILRAVADVTEGAPDLYRGSCTDDNGNKVGAWCYGVEPPAAPLLALAWIVERTADIFTDNLDASCPLAEVRQDERDSLRDFLAVADWGDAVGMDTAKIRGALPNDQVAAEILAWEPPAPPAPPPADPVRAALTLAADMLDVRAEDQRSGEKDGTYDKDPAIWAEIERGRETIKAALASLGVAS